MGSGMSRSDLPFWSGTNAEFLSNLSLGNYQAGLAQKAGVQLPWQTAGNASEQMLILRDSLKEASQLSSVGISTLSGVSPRSEALEGMIRDIGHIESPEEQVGAMDDLLREGDKLWSDQFAHIIARVVAELMDPDGLKLDDRARSRVCNRVLKAALKLSPEMLQDSHEQDVLKTRIKTLHEQCPDDFARNTAGILEESGFLEPVADVKYRGLADESPEGLAVWLKNEIITLSQRCILPDDISMMLDYAVTLPEELRGRILTMLVNLFDNTMQTEENKGLNKEICHLIDELPIKVRITPLEALYNKLFLAPHEISKEFIVGAYKSLVKMPRIQDFRFNRSLQDLLNNVCDLGRGLQKGDFRDGESFAQLTCRAQNRKFIAPTAGWD